MGIDHSVAGVETGWEVLGNAVREMACCQNTDQEWSRARIRRYGGGLADLGGRGEVVKRHCLKNYYFCYYD